MTRRGSTAWPVGVALAILLVPLALRAQEAATASTVLRSLEQSSRRVQHLLADVRASGDVARATCVDGTLSEIHARLRLALERASRRSSGSASTDAARLAVLTAEVRRLEERARRCVDPDLEVPSGRTRVVTTIEPWVPDVDPAELPRR